MKRRFHFLRIFLGIGTACDDGLPLSRELALSEFDFAIDQPEIAIAAMKGYGVIDGTGLMKGGDDVFEVQIDEWDLADLRFRELAEIAAGRVLDLRVQSRSDEDEIAFVI